MRFLTTHFSPKTLLYDGSALSEHWIYKQFDILGDALVSFIGQCDVALDKMVDLEDVKRVAPIYSSSMVHFIGEWFQLDLEKAVYLQHLLVFEIYQFLFEKGVLATRRGNDLYVENRKLNVSIATVSPVSALIHIGVNISNKNTPVPTSCLQELGIDPSQFALEILERFKTDFQIWQKAIVKARSV